MLNHTKKVDGSTDEIVSMSVAMYTDTIEIQIPACYFYGSNNPDKYILVGAQRDSLGPGVADALSGQS